MWASTQNLFFPIGIQVRINIVCVLHGEKQRQTLFCFQKFEDFISSSSTLKINQCLDETHCWLERAVLFSSHRIWPEFVLVLG